MEYRKMTQEELDRIVELRRRGLSIYKIGKQLGRLPSHIYYYLKKLGLQSDYTWPRGPKRVVSMRVDIDTIEAELIEKLSKMREETPETFIRRAVKKELVRRLASLSAEEERELW